MAFEDKNHVNGSGELLCLLCNPDPVVLSYWDLCVDEAIVHLFSCNFHSEIVLRIKNDDNTRRFVLRAS